MTYFTYVTNDMFDICLTSFRGSYHSGCECKQTPLIILAKAFQEDRPTGRLPRHPRADSSLFSRVMVDTFDCPDLDVPRFDLHDPWEAEACSLLLSSSRQAAPETQALASTRRSTPSGSAFPGFTEVLAAIRKGPASLAPSFTFEASCGDLCFI